MRKYIILKNIEIDGGYKIDFAEVEKKILEMDISEADRKSLGEYVEDCKKRNLTFAFRLSAFIKHDCGHWEHLQLAREEWINDRPGDGRCTNCKCGYWDLLKKRA